MPTPVLFLLIATLLPLAAFILLLCVGKRLGTPIAGWVATAFMAASFACTMTAMVEWYDPSPYLGVDCGFNERPISMTVPWLPAGGGVGQEHPGFLDLGFYVDSLTIAMFAMITLVATLVHVFSIGYMRRDPRFARFFTYLALFCFSMLGLVIGGTLLHIFIFWELVGLCSYLLIGFWFEKKSAANAAMKAFIINRIGDAGFLIGFGILFYHLGNTTLPQIWAALGNAGTGQAVALPGGASISAGLLTAMGICLFCGAIGKSAQFPLHVWLPSAMEGPTPVSALIHAATMVAAGVYLVGRVYPFLTPDAKLFIAIIGVTTLTMAALIAMVQSDIKRVLAYSTVSQLGFMMLAMGVGSWVGGLFHLMTHAFFKALLFLGAGSVILAAHHEQEIPEFGGLRRKIPVTAATFAIAVLAIAGTPLFSGYYSKSLIATHAGAFAAYATQVGGHAWGYWLFFALPGATSYLTAFYMARCWMLTFAGKARNPEVYENAREYPGMWGALVVLAGLSVISGGLWMGARPLLEASVRESRATTEDIRSRSAFYKGMPSAAFTQMWPAALPGEDAPRHAAAPTDVQPEPPIAANDSAMLARLRGAQLERTWLGWAWLIGIGLAVAVYWNGYAVADALLRVPPIRWVHTWLYHAMYFDEMYHWTLVKLAVAFSGLCGAFDRYVVDGAVNSAAWLVRKASIGIGLNDRYVVDGAVDGVGRLARNAGAAVRAPQNGRIRVYVTVLMVALALGLAGAIIAVLSR
ncbi:MAG: nuoL 2 [Phycisphaerales bacterium]|nr:nuoL 2 [Phycisphaerales bacterium]